MPRTNETTLDRWPDRWREQSLTAARWAYGTGLVSPDMRTLWRALWMARIQMEFEYECSDLEPRHAPQQPSPDKDEALARWGQAVAQARDVAPVTVDSIVRADMRVPGPLRRRFLTLSPDERNLPLEQLTLDRRPDRWVHIDEQNLHTRASSGTPGLAYWAAVTYDPCVVHLHEHGRSTVTRVPAFVADLLERHHIPFELVIAVAASADTTETITVAARLYQENRYRTGPLQTWSAALTVARDICR